MWGDLLYYLDEFFSLNFLKIWSYEYLSLLVWGYSLLWKLISWQYEFESEAHPINPLTPNDHFSGRTAPLTSKGCILYIYSTNKGTEYFKHGI